MNYVLDTDIVIYFLKGHKSVTTKILSKAIEELAITRITATELLFGAYNSEKQQDNLKLVHNLLNDFYILEFEETASEIFAYQKAFLKKSGSLIADMDLMIASICLAQKKVLVTNNTRHFERIKDLKLENWSEERFR